MELGWLKHLVPMVAGAAVTSVVLRCMYKGAHVVRPVQENGVRVYTYTPKARKTLLVVGIVSILFALLPAIAIPYKYFGPEPCGHSTKPCRNKPVEDAIAGTLLFLGFGLGGLYCFIDPKKYYVRTDDKGITVRGMFSGVKSLDWDKIRQVKDYSSSQMLRLCGFNAKYAKISLWVPYTIGGMPRLLQEFDDHAVPFADRWQYLHEIKKYLASMGHPDPKPLRIFFPFISIWQLQPDDPSRLGAVLIGFVDEDSEEDVYALQEENGTTEELLKIIHTKLVNREYSFHPDYQSAVLIDLEDILREKRS